MLSATPLRPTDERSIGPFRLLGRLAEGGMGTVYLGRYDGRAESLVAVKTLRTDLATDQLFRSRFVSERDASRLVSEDPASSSYVARLIDSDVSARVPWLASEYIPGPTLHHEAARRGGLPPHELDGVARGLAEALSCLHGHGFTHGDVKPLNILLGPDGVRLVDLGLARRIARQQTTLVLGSPGWTPPGHREGDPASDVHGWGMSVAYAATGSSPFGSGTPDEISARMAQEPPDLRALPDDLHELVLASLAPDAAARPTSTELLSALERADAGGTRSMPVSASTQPLLPDTQGLASPTVIEPAAAEAPVAPQRTDRRRLALAAAVLVLVVALLSAVGLRGTDATATPTPAGTPTPTAAPPTPTAPAARSSSPAPVRTTTAAAPVTGTKQTGPTGPAGKGKGHGKKGTGHPRK